MQSIVSSSTIEEVLAAPGAQVVVIVPAEEAVGAASRVQAVSAGPALSPDRTTASLDLIVSSLQAEPLFAATSLVSVRTSPTEDHGAPLPVYYFGTAVPEQYDVVAGSQDNFVATAPRKHTAPRGRRPKVVITGRSLNQPGSIRTAAQNLCDVSLGASGAIQEFVADSNSLLATVECVCRKSSKGTAAGPKAEIKREAHNPQNEPERSDRSPRRGISKHRGPLLVNGVFNANGLAPGETKLPVLNLLYINNDRKDSPRPRICHRKQTGNR